ncbi:LysR family transcriptional regulator [Halomonas sp. MCCC 1A17488]|uniref:LysR family transcriptional regulator n=1 Tax=Billgrantia sulfidoxydans TaxID=2733484 RepID=A0ABX7W9B6_9GAMM|nr:MULTISPECIES: LysR family transcriptional regulator [Halomonas]MCE8017617.1 LysR family transcriptional regulator [Halomonas sp. MCCC 1A17488]MCG3240950.1 LysR family transcriptional regulator [Halomonas sp. MCCC 1A17488]QPP48820.1 LysR family transcriptional regulator [Halomonas sp. SS10-MC5]QTP56152.1 LysR family transcriptional regulator [Halomonas sulfidoxydans]
MAQLDDLVFFQQLARAGSLTATARDLGLSLSAVSKRLKQLEARLGVELASRTTRRLSLTAEGERYLERGAAILEELAELEEALGEQQAALSGPLRVNATFGFGRRHVAPLLSAFCARHPSIEATLELSNYPLSLGEQGFDVGIRVGEPPDSRLVARRILANRRVLCASPAYVARMPPLASPADLTAHSCLVLRENESDYAVWRFRHRGGSGEEQAVKVAGPLASNDGEVIVRLALDGHGIALRSWWDVHRHLAEGRLVALLPEWRGVRADFHAVYQQRRHVPARIRAFVAFLEEHMPGRVPAIDDAC